MLKSYSKVIFLLIILILSCGIASAEDPGMEGGMIAHEGREDAQLQETGQQVLRDIAAEAAQVAAGIEEAAEIQVRQHLQGHLQVAPPGEIIPLPDAAVAVGADEGGTGEQQETPVRIETAEGIRRGAGHEGAIQVMHPVMADRGAVHLMIEGTVILRIVRDAVEDILQAPHGFIVHIAGAQLLHPAEGGGHAVLRIEQGGLIHIVPETFDTGRQQGLVEIAEPAAGILPEEIGEAAVPGPDGGGEIGAVLLFAEVTAGFSGVIRRVAFLPFDAGIDNRNQADMILLHVRAEAGQVREGILPPGEVFEIFHIVDIEADRVQRDAPLPVLRGDGADFRLAGIAPAALDIAEGPAGREIAAPGEAAEGTGQLREGILLQDIQVQLAVLRGDNGGIRTGIPEIPGDRARIIQEDAEERIRTEKDQEGMGAVEAVRALRMVKDIIVPGAVQEAALINAADGFAQAEEAVLRLEGAGQHDAVAVPGKGEEGNRPRFRRQGKNNSIRRERGAEGILPDHEKTSLCGFFDILPWRQQDCKASKNRPAQRPAGRNLLSFSFSVFRS